MHYGSYAFAVDWEHKTITPRKSNITLRNAYDKTYKEVLTDIDTLAIRTAYQCVPWTTEKEPVVTMKPDTEGSMIFKFALKNNLKLNVSVYLISNGKFNFVTELVRNEQWSRETYVGYKWALSTYSSIYKR